MHCILLDAAKAFDRMDHTALLRILQSIGLDTISLKWFFLYLSGRCIRTKVNSHTSSSSPITSGVPQGSVLGPLLFLIYYKDIATVATAMTALFADDTLLFHPACHGSKTPLVVRFKPIWMPSRPELLTSKCHSILLNQSISVLALTPVRKFSKWMVLPSHNAKKPGILAFA